MSPRSAYALATLNQARNSFLLAAATLMSTTVLQAQNIPERALRSSCPTCRITLAVVAELGHASDSVSPSRYSTVVATQAGEFIVGPTHAPGVVAVYSPDGAFRRSIGRRGQGPGEFRGISSVGADRKGEIYVFEHDRVTAIASSTWRPSGTRTLPLPVYAAIQLDSARTVVAASLGRTGGAELVHVVANQSVIASFSPEVAPNGNSIWRKVRRLALAERGLWVAHANQYVLELYTEDGQLINRLRRTTSWFEPWHSSTSDENFATRPQPNVVSVQELDDGNLAVLIYVADSSWEPVARPGESVNLDRVDVTGSSIRSSRSLIRVALR